MWINMLTSIINARWIFHIKKALTLHLLWKDTMQFPLTNVSLLVLGWLVVWCVGGDGWWEQRQHTCEIVIRGYYTESSPINSLDRR